jgi:hypothetical protein
MERLIDTAVKTAKKIVTAVSTTEAPAAHEKWYDANKPT